MMTLRLKECNLLLLYLKQMTSADLLYSTGNSAQCYVAGWMRGIWGRVDTCICMAEFLYCLPETITILLIGYTPYKIKSLKKRI